MRKLQSRKFSNTHVGNEFAKMLDFINNEVGEQNLQSISYDSWNLIYTVFYWTNS